MPHPTSEQAVFRAIADPTRRAIIGLLADAELSVGDIAARFDMTRPGVAKHLKVLEQGGLIETRSEGRTRYNRLSPAPLKDVANWLSYYDRFWDDKLAKLKAAVEGQHD